MSFHFIYVIVFCVLSAITRDGYDNLGTRFFEALPFLEFDMSDMLEDDVLNVMRSEVTRNRS